jgi:transient receptor potential cation channel subfamily V protein 6
VLLLLCVPLRVSGHRLLEEQLLVIAIPAAHLLLISHAAAFRLTGPFVAMIRHMFLKDLTQFSLIYLLFLYAFSLPFHFLLRQRDDLDESSDQSLASTLPKVEAYSMADNQSIEVGSSLTISTDSAIAREFNSDDIWAYASCWMRLFKMTLGSHNHLQLRFARFGWLTVAMFVLFIILVPILLLNMLIAMMGNTYGEVIAKSEREWSRQWAKMLIDLERGLNPDEAMACINAYSMILTRSKCRSRFGQGA